MKSLYRIGVFVFGLALLAACGGGGGGSDAASTGTLSVSASDATLPGFQAIYVTIDEVAVHREDGDGWQVVSTPQTTVNLLELVNGVREHLGEELLPTGLYTQIRLLLGTTPDGENNILGQPHPHATYFIDDNDEVVPLIVPSGQQTGIKLVNAFDIFADETTEIVLDFDAAHSVVRAGNSGRWLFKPTIKVLHVGTLGVVSGVVTYNAATLVEGVTISAQNYNSAAADPKDRVIVEGATVTDENGEYSLSLPPGDYNLVAFLGDLFEAFGPDCAAVTVVQNTITTVDFDLVRTEAIGNITGELTISDPPAEEDQHAALSMRQGAACNGGLDQIEVTGVNIALDGFYNVALPAATYNVVGSTAERDTLVEEDVVVSDGGTETIDFFFEF